MQSRLNTLCKILIKFNIWSISNLWNIAVNTKVLLRFKIQQISSEIREFMREFSVTKCKINLIIKIIYWKIQKFTNYWNFESLRFEIFMFNSLLIQISIFDCFLLCCFLAIVSTSTYHTRAVERHRYAKAYINYKILYRK